MCFHTNPTQALKNKLYVFGSSYVASTLGHILLLCSRLVICLPATESSGIY